MRLKLLLTLFLLLPFQSQAFDAITEHPSLGSGLQAYWSFEETSGARLDATSTNDLSDINSVSYGTGVRGNAALFSSSLSQTLRVDDASQTGLDASAERSVACWVNFSSNPTLVRTNIASKGSFETGSQRQYSLQVDGTDIVSARTSGGNTNALVKGPHGITTNSWHLISFTYKTLEYKAFVDGSQLGTTKTDLTGSIDNATKPFTIGSDDSSANFMNGYIDECGVWDRALTNTEESDLWNSGAGMCFDGCGVLPVDNYPSVPVVISDNIKGMNPLKAVNCTGVAPTTTCTYTYATSTPLNVGTFFDFFFIFVASAVLTTLFLRRFI